MLEKKQPDQLTELEEHIAQCKQCQNSPYDPCFTGKEIVRKVVEESRDISRARARYFFPRHTYSTVTDNT
jgi:hypothetical protein